MCCFCSIALSPAVGLANQNAKLGRTMKQVNVGESCFSNCTIGRAFVDHEHTSLSTGTRALAPRRNGIERIWTKHHAARSSNGEIVCPFERQRKMLGAQRPIA